MITNEFKKLLEVAERRDGLVLVLADADDQCFTSFRFKVDPLDNEIARDVLFHVAQWLAENGYMSTADNKSMLGRVE